MKTRTADYSPSLDHKYFVESCYEWADYLFISRGNNRIVFRGVVNLNKNLSGDTNYDLKRWTWQGLLNDVDGGMPFWPGWNQPDGSITSVIDAGDLIGIYNHNLTLGLQLDPVKQARFKKEVISRLTEMSNPVIMRIAK
jgi:hypothetical protein